MRGSNATDSTAGSPDGKVSLLRLNLLRANYLVWAVAGPFLALPPLVAAGPTDRGALASIFAGLWVMGLIGLRHPLRMLPIFLFEFTWKSLWLLAFGLPQWLAGPVTPRLAEDLWSIGTGPLLFGLIIPWRHVWHRYILAPAERWRAAPTPGRRRMR